MAAANEKKSPSHNAAPVRVMRIIARLNVGGPSIHVSKLSSGLPADKYETILVTGVISPNEGDMSYMARDAGVEPIIIPTMQREISVLSDIKSVLHLYKLMRKHKPTVVHTHTFKAGAVGRVAAKLAGVPVVVHTFHGHVFHGYWGALISKGIVVVEQILSRLSTAILTVSEKVKTDLLHYKIAAPSKISVLPLGLDLERFKANAQFKGELRQELGVAADCSLIGIVGRLVPIKNHHLFLDAAKNAVAAGFDGKFLIVGGGELEETLNAYAQQLGIADQLIFMGWRQDLPRIYADLDVLVLSSNNEGTPVSIIEAMAASVPVVATDVGGVGDLVQNGQTGYLVPSQDPVALANAMLTALQDGTTYTPNAQDFVLERHNLQRLYDSVETLYDSLLR